MSKKNTYPLILVLAILVLFAVVGLFVNNFTHVKKKGGFHVHEADRPRPDIEKIQGWMTFEYLNRSFNLPTDYLQKDIEVTSSSYPNVTLIKEATLRGQDLAVFLGDVKKSIKKYQADVHTIPQ
jgi:hypothetical protein